MAALPWIGHGSYWTWRGIVPAAIASLAIAISLYLLGGALLFVRRWIWEPWMVARHLIKQGYSGPPFTCFSDNSREIQQLTATATSEPLQSVSHDFHSRIFAHTHAWTKLYGQRFIFSPGRGVVMLNSAEPKIVQDVFNDLVTYEKSLQDKHLADLLGSRGLVFSNHEKWAKQRRVLRPMFYPSRSKEMVNEMASWIEPWLDKLEKLVAENGGVIDTDITTEVGEVTKDILARSSFGSNVTQGREVFDSLLKLAGLVTQNAFISPAIRSLPFTSLNRKISKAKEEVSKNLQNVIQGRRDSVKAAGSAFYGDDLLGVLLTENETQKALQERWTDEELKDQCKTFFFAGSDTVHSTLLWAIVLLAHYREWQDRIRAEVKKVFQDAAPDGKKLTHLKSLHMFVDETLRLYPPVPQMNREVVKDDVKLLGEPVLQRLTIRHDILALHRDPELWGDDALEFKPERFAKGAAKACNNVYAYVPFGAGPRACVAQPFALTEVKLVLAMLLVRFSMQLSPSYRHEPIYRVNVVPKFGVQVILELVDGHPHDL